MAIPVVTIYPAIYYDYHEHVQYMHNVISHIPFDDATSLVNNAIAHGINNTEEHNYDNNDIMNDIEEYKHDNDINMDDIVEYKDDIDNDMDISVEFTNNDIIPRERTLDALFLYDDDLDETKSIIWVQFRK